MIDHFSICLVRNSIRNAITKSWQPCLCVIASLNVRVWLKDYQNIVRVYEFRYSSLIIKMEHCIEEINYVNRRA